MFKNAYNKHLDGGMDAWDDSYLSINLQVSVQVQEESTTRRSSADWQKYCTSFAGTASGRTYYI